MGFFRTLFVLAVIAIGSWVLFNNNTQIQDMIQSYVENGEILTLEARYSADQIMRSNKESLLPNKDYSYQDPSLKFYPYLMMEVKFTQANGRTREGVILWSMVDGEMVIDTDSWEKTHGFEDAINAKASRSDLILMNILSQSRNGSLPITRLQKALNVDSEVMDKMIRSATEKYLIIQNGNEIVLHFENPNFNVPPQTRINQWLVTKPYNHAQRVSKRYSKSQIEKIAKATFGSDFSIRNSKEVFLPVYNIEVLNPDGSILTSYWNALNGQRVDTKFLSQSP